MRAIKDTRDIAALRRHYLVEHELAQKLRLAPTSERLGLYSGVYNDLFRRVPDHPQNTRKKDPGRQYAKAVGQFQLVRHFLASDRVYLEIGAGDCFLAKMVARHVRCAYAVDVSDVIADRGDAPGNFRLVISDGTSITVPGDTVDIAYSHQLIEHLHPEDAGRHLREVFSALAPGGSYVIVTPHRFSGPHDISKHFKDTADGFHLKEYTYAELISAMRTTGFSTFQVWGGLRGRYLRLPTTAVLALERLLSWCPVAIRRWIARLPVVNRMFEDVVLAAKKRHAGEA